MKVRRTFALFLLGMVGLWRCGDGREPSGKVDLEKVDPRDQQVTFWHQHSGERAAALLELIDTFNRTNEYGIQVIGEYAGNHDEIYEKMLVRLQSGVLPSLVIAYRYQAQAYYQNGGGVDLSPYLNSPRWGLNSVERSDYFEEFIDQDRIEGIQVAFLPSRSMEVLYYNADWLRELGYQAPPRTWSEFAAVCRQAAVRPFSQATEQGPSTGLAFDLDASRLASMVFSRNADLIDAAGREYTLATPQVTQSLALLRDLVDEYAAMVRVKQADVQHLFSVGRALFVMRSSSGMPLYRESVANEAGFSWDIAPVPYEGQQPILNVYGASLAVCRTTPEQQLAAWLFIKWFTEPAQQEEWASRSNYFPVRRSSTRNIASFFRISYDLLEYGKAEPWLIGYGTVRQMIEQTMKEVLDGGDLEQHLARLQTQANRTLTP